MRIIKGETSVVCGEYLQLLCLLEVGASKNIFVHLHLKNKSIFRKVGDYALSTGNLGAKDLAVRVHN